MNNADIDYKDGLDDGRMEAWECARKIRNMTMDECEKIFGEYRCLATILSNVSASEAIEKIKEHEEESQMSDKWINLKDVIKVLTKNRVHFYDMVKITSELKELPSINPVPSGDLISRQAVLETLDDMDNALDEDRTVENYKELLKKCYEVLPPVNPQPRTGHWIINKEKSLAKCSNCKFLLKDKDEIKLFGTFMQGYNYCPNCGARMESEEKE